MKAAKKAVNSELDENGRVYATQKVLHLPLLPFGPGGVHAPSCTHPDRRSKLAHLGYCGNFREGKVFVHSFSDLAR